MHSSTEEVINVDTLRQRLTQHTRFFERLYRVAQQEQEVVRRGVGEGGAGHWKEEVQRIVDEFSI